MKVKIAFVAILLCLLLPCLIACGNNKDVYASNAEKGFTSRVTYDFGDGLLDGKNTLIVLSTPTAPLPEPGVTEASPSIAAPILAGHHIEGYYTKDENGNERDWNFAADRAEGDITLYARWRPDYAVRVLYGDNFSQSYSIPVSAGVELTAMRSTDWSGHTFYGFYEDAACTTPLAFPFTPAVSAETPTVTVYARYLEGTYTVIRRAADFSKAIKAGTNYYIDADIDLTDTPIDIMEFYSGRFIGNGHTIKGLKITRKQGKSTENYGLFGTITGTAVFENITFEDVSVVVHLNNYSNPNTENSCIGTLAGSVNAGATFNNVKVTGSLTYYCYDRGLTLPNVDDLFGYCDPGVDTGTIEANVTVTQIAGAPAAE